MGRLDSSYSPFRSYSLYLREKYNTSVYRVSVDAGFSCPHKGTDRNSPGCTYCDPYGSRAPYLGDALDLREQIQSSMSFLSRRYGAKCFILYFQAFSNTFAPVDILKKIYDRALKLYLYSLLG